MEAQSEISRVKIGQVLMHRGQAKYQQVEFMLDLQSAYRAQGRERFLGDLLVEHRVITPLALAEALVAQEEMPVESITRILEAMAEFPSKLTKLFAD